MVEDIYDICSNILTSLDVSHIGIVLIGFMLSYLMISSLFSHEEKPQMETTPVKKYNGTWKSKIYDNENGTIKIKLLEPEDKENSFCADVDLTYSSTSTFKPNQKISLNFDCEYDEWNKSYILKQQDTDHRSSTDGQYFLLHFKKNTKRYPVGNLVCVGPADLCEITFEVKKDIPKK